MQVPAVQSSRAAPARGAPAPAGASRRMGLMVPSLALLDKPTNRKGSGFKGIREPSARLPAGCSGQQGESPSSCHQGGLINLRQPRCEASASRVTGRPNVGQDEYLERPDDTAASITPLEVASRPNGTSCNGVPVPPRAAEGVDLSVEVDPTAQLRRLAELAKGMMDKNKTRDNSHGEVGDDGSGNGSDAAGSATPPRPRRDHFLSTAFLAKLDHEESSADRGVPTTAMAWAGVEAQAMTPTSQRRRNRLPSPATLAILKPDLEERQDVAGVSVEIEVSTAMARATTAETGGDAAAQWLGLRPLGMEAAAMNSSPKAKEKCPSIRAKAKQPPRGQKRPFSATSKRAPRRGVMAVQNEEEDLEEEEEEDHGHHEQRGALPERPKRSSRSATGDRKRPANSKEERSTHTFSAIVRKNHNAAASGHSS